LIDDSESMREHRGELQDVFEALAKITVTTDPDGIDLYFTNSPTTPQHDKKWKPLVQLIERRKFTGDCDMKSALQSIFDDFTANFDTSLEKPRTNKRLSRFNPFASKAAGSHKKKRGLSVYVLTTGVWQKRPRPVCGVDEPIRNVVCKLNENKHLDTRVGVQFIHFGDDAIGASRVAYLDCLRKYKPDILMYVDPEMPPLREYLDIYPADIFRDIVDSTKSTGNVLKMLLGASNRQWDDDDGNDDQAC
jgi:hypothetical protein